MAVGHAHSLNVSTIRSIQRFTEPALQLLHQARQVSSPRVPFVAQGMSLLETSSFIRGGCITEIHTIFTRLYCNDICSAGYVSARDF